eukprot:scaffold250275_cov41-Tisochrysis_lutea.AAC.1
MKFAMVVRISAKGPKWSCHVVCRGVMFHVSCIAWLAQAFRIVIYFAMRHALSLLASFFQNRLIASGAPSGSGTPRIINQELITTYPAVFAYVPWVHVEAYASPYAMIHDPLITDGWIP